MLDLARPRAASLGLTNVEFMELDADRLDFPDQSFDAVLCRWGIMSLPNPPGTLAAIRRMLAPGGLFATAVWVEGPRGRPLASLASAVAREMFGPPSPPEESSTLPGSARKALEEAMTHAGFGHVRIEEMTLALRFAAADDRIQYLMDVSPDFAALLSSGTPGEQAEYRRSVAGRFRHFAAADGSIRIPNVTICAAGQPATPPA
jgi:SAM-dependent methyltransferase